MMSHCRVLGRASPEQSAAHDTRHALRSMAMPRHANAKHAGLFAASLLVGLVVLALVMIAGVRTVTSYAGETLVQCFPPTSAVSSGPLDDLEIRTFVENVTSPVVLEAAVQDARASRLAPTWFAGHSRSGSIDVERAVADLESRVRVQRVTGTDFMQITVYHDDEDEALGLATMITDAFVATDPHRLIVADRSTRRKALLE